MSTGDRLEVALAAGSRGPREARDHVRAFLDSQDLNGEAEQAALVIASELVTNAVVHGSAPITLEVALLDHTLHLAVHDGDACAAVVAIGRADRGDTSGRGLKLVASLARCWGVQANTDGKRVWAEIDVPSRERAAPA
jgi:anti-sigma regulatory factor (Ser/Thr protein kinase)